MICDVQCSKVRTSNFESKMGMELSFKKPVWHAFRGE